MDGSRNLSTYMWDRFKRKSHFQFIILVSTRKIHQREANYRFHSLLIYLLTSNYRSVQCNYRDKVIPIHPDITHAEWWSYSTNFSWRPMMRYMDEQSTTVWVWIWCRKLFPGWYRTLAFQLVSSGSADIALLVHETKLIIYIINKHILFRPTFPLITFILRLLMRKTKPTVEEKARIKREEKWNQGHKSTDNEKEINVKDVRFGVLTAIVTGNF